MISRSYLSNIEEVRVIKRLLLTVFTMLFVFLSTAYSAQVMLSWDYDHSVANQVNSKFRIYSKKTTETIYPTIPNWDSKGLANPQIHTATLTIEDGINYNLIARAYNETADAKVLESENSNEVTFIAPAFVMSGLVLTSFTNSEKYEKPVYFGTTGVDIVISWTSLSGATYEYRLYDIIRKNYTLTGTTSVANAKFKIPKTGCYEFEVRAKRNTTFTEWTKLDSRIIGWIATAGPIVIK